MIKLFFIVGSITVLTSFSSLFFFVHLSHFSEENNQKPDKISNETVSCRVSPQNIQVQGKSMEPYIPEGQNLLFFPDFYQKCSSKIQTGDIVAYQNTENNSIFIKQVYATAGDSVSFSNTSLFINSIKIKNSAGEPYILSPAEQKIIAAGLKNGILPKNTVLILGDNIKNSEDSRNMGVIQQKNIIGKFEVE